MTAVKKPVGNAYGLFEIIGTIEAKESSQLAAPNMLILTDEARRLAELHAGEVNAICIRLNNTGGSSRTLEQIS